MRNGFKKDFKNSFAETKRNPRRMHYSNINALIDHMIGYDGDSLTTQLCVFESQDGMPFQHYVYARLMPKYVDNQEVERVEKKMIASTLDDLEGVILCNEDVGYRIGRKDFKPEMVTVMVSTDFSDNENYQGFLIDLSDAEVFFKLSIDYPDFFKPKPRFITSVSQLNMVALVERHCVFQNITEESVVIPVYSSDYKPDLSESDEKEPDYIYFLKGQANRSDCEENLNFTYYFDHNSYIA